MMLNTSTYYINASLSCIDLAHIEASMYDINLSSIHSLHYDVVDGMFNECFMFGDRMLRVFRDYTSLPITVHLACENPLPYLKPMIQNGADYVVVHYEAHVDIADTFLKIRELGAKPVLAFRCDSEVPKDFIKLARGAEWILKLCVQPGFSGQNFHKGALKHIKEMHQQLQYAHLDKIIEADGNIHTGTIIDCVKAGATMFTGGTSGLFNHKHSFQENIELLHKAIIRGGKTHGSYDE